MSQIKDEIKREIVSLPHVTRTQTDVQRLKLEKLMKNPEKPVVIPERAKERGPPAVPDFVRNVMGSSAGAGSGEFHVYRHLRRKEYARQNFMQKRAQWEQLEQEYHQKIEQNKRKAEELTARKRAKRLKKKKNMKHKQGKRVAQKQSSSSEEDSDEDEVEESENRVGVDSAGAENSCSSNNVNDNIPDPSTKLTANDIPEASTENPVQQSPATDKNNELEETSAEHVDKDQSISKNTEEDNL